MNPPGIYERQEPEAGAWDRNLPCVVKAKRPVKLDRSEQGGKALQMRQSIKGEGRQHRPLSELGFALRKIRSHWRLSKQECDPAHRISLVYKNHCGWYVERRHRTRLEAG